MNAILTLVKHVGALAVVLVALAFAGGTAEAAAHGHQDHGLHHADHAQAEPAAPTAHDHESGHGDGGVHHGDCHCMSAACASVLPPAISGHKAVKLRARHDRPLAARAQALAGVDPPAKPPRL